MKKLLLLMFFILPLPSVAQYWFTEEENYFFVSSGLDIRNATLGGTVNPAAYDGSYTFGYRNHTFSLLVYYETFKAIRYESFGINPGYVFRPGRMLVPVVDISLSFIRRPWNIYPSLALNTRLEYHFDRFFVYLRGEYRWRTDYDFFQASLYGGISFKFGFEN